MEGPGLSLTPPCSTPTGRSVPAAAGTATPNRHTATADQANEMTRLAIVVAGLLLAAGTADADVTCRTERAGAGAKTTCSDGATYRTERSGTGTKTTSNTGTVCRTERSGTGTKTVCR